ncbi:kinase-like domain-containing protein [Radiomyces spectabilis]|uniref:kinase-like domain-containing protein n=1 Tax=Radiomyces spectabilis TaxID=64574 RepID=UPI00221E4832|nr:kinase-like domain-containing protein [Radiomyces spectabilis]KAI8391515.1 kinase-like domain-containing protein [Radiomyces spectabilis]
MQHVNGVPVHNSDPCLIYDGLDTEPTWFSAQGGVYRCTERRSGRLVAIKKYLVEEYHHEDMFVMPKELVENEIYTMTKCIHPNILKLLAVYLHQEFVFLVMPLCEGGSLQQYVFDHHLTVGQVVHIVHSVAAGLAEIHRHGYIHRDIKCDNIFLDQASNTIVIGDFGVVSISATADSSVEEAGVVLFWSPELVQRKVVNRKVDIWALGIVILEILNGGKAPYEDEKLEEEEIKQRILDNGRPLYPANLPSRLKDLLDRCLEPDPRARISADDVLQHPFLRDYEPEPLFPATRLDHDFTCSTSGSDQSDILSEKHDHHDIHHDAADDAMMNALKKLRALEALHDFDIGIPTSLETPPPSQPKQAPQKTSSPPPKQTPYTKPSLSHLALSDVVERPPSLSPPPPIRPTNPIKKGKATPAGMYTRKLPRSLLHSAASSHRCRLPMPSFIVNETEAAAIPSQQKVANVLRKRQSMSEANRNQGSRLPMLTLPTAEPLIEKEEPVPTPVKQIRKVKSVRPSSDKQTESKSALTRSRTMPLQTRPAKPRTENGQRAPDSTKSNADRKEKPSSQRSDRALTLRQGKPSTGTSPKSATVTEKSGKPISVKPKTGTTSTPHTPLQKRLPKPSTGESRTARLMKGISTSDYRSTSRDSPAGSESVETTTDDKKMHTMRLMAQRRLGHALNVKESADKTKQVKKRRPMSFNNNAVGQKPNAGDVARSPHTMTKSTFGSPSSLPKYDLKARRQSAPAPPTKTNSPNLDKNGPLKCIKVLRVH